MHWYDYIVGVVAGLIVLWALIGLLDVDFRWEEEKRLHRKYGGHAPKD